MSSVIDISFYILGWVLCGALIIMFSHISSTFMNKGVDDAKLTASQMQNLASLIFSLSISFLFLSGMPLLAFLQAFYVKRFWEYGLTLSLFALVYYSYKLIKSFIKN